jgi:hypothetical protein
VKAVKKSKSKIFYDNNPDSKEKKAGYDSEYHKTPKRKKYRAKLNKENYKRGTYGNGDGKDVSHTKGGKLVLENQSTNRARNRGKK